MEDNNTIYSAPLLFHSYIIVIIIYRYLIVVIQILTYYKENTFVVPTNKFTIYL